MKKLLLIICLAFVASLAQAQWKIGPKVGFGVITQGDGKINVMPMSDHGLYDLQFHGGTAVSSAGLMIYRDLGPFFLQMEGLGSQYRLDYLIDGYTQINDNSKIYSEQYYSLELKATAGIRINNFKIGLGPVFEYNLDKNSQLEDVFNYKNKTQKMDKGFQALVGYQFSAFHLDVSYVTKFSGISDSFEFGQDVFTSHGSVNRLGLSLGMVF